jgi:hypothetical protein
MKDKARNTIFDVVRGVSINPFLDGRPSWLLSLVRPMSIASSYTLKTFNPSRSML